MDSYTRGVHRFDVSDRGDRGRPAVVLLHGFPADRHGWDAVSDRLVDAGYRTVAPDQRGYSAGAAPAGRRAYRVDELAADIVALADAAGVGRFHVVGHDWGAVVAWHLAAGRADRVRTLTAVSVPHPGAMADAAFRSSQLLHSWYMLAFQVPWVPEHLLASGGGTWFRRSLLGSGLDDVSADRYAARTAEELRGPLGWYRALPFTLRSTTGPVSVPTTMVWGTGDRFLTRAAAEGSQRHVRGPYRFVEIAGGTHWLPERNAAAVAGAVLDRIGAAPE